MPGRRFGALVSGLGIPFPGNGDWGSRRLGSNMEFRGKNSQAPACPFRKCDPHGFATSGRIVTSSSSMLTILHMLLIFVVGLFKSRSRLEAENLFLRHQLNFALLRARPRLRLRGGDRVLLVSMVRLWPSLLGLAKVVQPETILRWHRSGFKAFWRWKSRNRAGRPKVDRELGGLIRRMGRENPLWGAPRIHGELLMLGFEVAQSTVSKYMVQGRRLPSNPGRRFFKTTLRQSLPSICAWSRR